ncbi:MAG TPA: hypothetical protein VJS87_04985 [Solirubrobacterales bacterium]|nr:hypothetical protein [Solirubrobacterales bacterium]
MPKPHRVLIDRVSGYADEAAAFVRRRRLTRREFARLYYADGSAAEHAAGTESGDALFAAAAGVIELAEDEKPASGGAE